MDHCLCVGIDSLANGGLAFVNCTRDALLGGLFNLLPAKTAVVEILETVEPDTEVVEACINLQKLGYAIALDDFVPDPKWAPLVKIADYIKVDFRVSGAATRRVIRSMARLGHAALLAEKIEDQAEFQLAMQEGFEFFQGYFFCRPKIVANREIPQNRLNYLRLMVQLTRNPLNVREVVRIVQTEASLCYRLLRLANSALWGQREAVTSVRGALLLVGENRFRTLVSVAASTALGQEGSPALINLSLERARFCELVAPLIGENPTEQFMLGMMSLVDAMLETPMESVVGTLPLRQEAKDALVGIRNPTAAALCLVRSFESGSWAGCSAAVNLSEIGEDKLTELYLEAVQWASDSVSAGA
jgi:EAL and modified HD-GYP domain-containing signal transduction protein